MAYCTNCGKETEWTSKSGYCKACAEAVLKERKGNIMAVRGKSVSRKNWMAALLLCIFLGMFGAHRFYVGKSKSGFAYLFTAGIFGIGYIVDIILIAVGSFEDSRGFYVLRNKKPAYAQSRPASPSSPPSSPSSPPSPPPPSPSSPSSSARKDYPRLSIPDFLGNQIRLYYYKNVPFFPSANAINEAERMQMANDWELTPEKHGDDIMLFHNGVEIGRLLKKTEMVSDWLQREETVKIWLLNIGDDNNSVYLAFYRDEEARLSYRESQVVKLTKFSGESEQDALLGLEGRYKLDIEEDYDSQGNDVFRVVFGAPIGVLPKKIAERHQEESIHSIFLDHVDYDDEKDKDVPYVKIYW